MMGTKIKNIRTKKGFSQEFMADQLNISQSTFHYIETGKSKLNIDLLQKITSILEVDLCEFLSDNGLKQVAKDNANGYLAQIQNVNFSKELIAQYERRIADKIDLIKTKDSLIKELNNKIAYLELKIGS